MILVFGGTTEGRKAAEVLDEAGSPYFYSTKTGEQVLTLKHGQRMDGALDGEAMQAFCRSHAIRLIVDAAHPFAAQLHATVASVAASLSLPLVRYERIYPPRTPDIEWIDNYDQVPTDIHTLLATTGVQSIAKLKPLETRGVKVYYRILPRESSIALARAQGVTDHQLCFYEDGGQIEVEADAILLKESGMSGGFVEKVAAARARGMRIIALKRPHYSPPLTSHSSLFTTVNGPYGLRRAVERLLPDFYPLHSGLTTGTCATAAAVAATLQRLGGECSDEVPVVLPNGETIDVAVGYGNGYAYCIKQAGDDPDVTDGIEIDVNVNGNGNENGNGNYPSIIIKGGEGVGTFTLPGFDYPPGSPAINRVPRQMIETNVMAQLKNMRSTSGCLLPKGCKNHTNLTITISVPHGAETARRTFNPRLGIEGGISIIGVSGIVMPFSEEAFIEAIGKCLQVAVASGAERIVINSGAKSERYLKALYPTLPPQAFVEYGNYVGATLQMAAEQGVRQLTLGVMLGKAVKLAAGQMDTHSRKGTMDRSFISQLLCEADCQLAAEALDRITLARELWLLIPPDRLQSFVSVVISHCASHCRPLLPNGELTILLIDDDGNIYHD